MASSSFTKHKRVTLTIEQKLDILKKLDQGSTMSSIASEFGVGKSTVFDIKNSREKIIKFAGEAQDDSSLKSRCIVRRADGELMVMPRIEPFTTGLFRKDIREHQLVVFW